MTESTTNAVATHQVFQHRSLLSRATEVIEHEDAFLAELVAKHQPEDEEAFRLERRAQWLAVRMLEEIEEVVWADDPFVFRSFSSENEPSTTAEYVEMLREVGSQSPEYCADRRARFAELMRKIEA